MTRRPRFSFVNRAFSLLEMLAVMAVCGVLVALSAPAFTSSLRAGHLNTAGRQIIDQLNFARQTALTRNLPVEVRFYKLPAHGAGAASAPDVYRGMQCFISKGGTATPLGRPVFFSAPVISSAHPAESPLLGDGLTREIAAPSEALASYGHNYRYRSFSYRPGGSPSLPQTDIFLTLVLEGGRPLAEGANYFSVQIDPVTGRPRELRP
jgi:uncharacterized protein (TIGR02596 family)